MSTTLKYRSKFESNVAEMIRACGVKPLYEVTDIVVPLPIRMGNCPKCGNKDVVRGSHYRPDFTIRVEGKPPIFVEAKGILTYRDKCLAEYMSKHHNWKIVFMADNKLNKRSPTRYSDWCRKNGVQFAVNNVPKEWFQDGAL